ncbi:MAG: 7,8-dihydroneopterin aldolase/epimerase/oxygenase [Clostridia bacterium]|nr:7,8-dihydroneopterin aldolase/epimerase/oxygenase [Clostridia bacterium]
MEFYGYHGVHPAEHELGQPFIVDLELYLDLTQAAKSDDIKATINYLEIYSLVKKIVTDSRFNLLEALAETISNSILENFPVNELLVRVRKPHAPLPGTFNYAGVEIKRKNSTL